MSKNFGLNTQWVFNVHKRNVMEGAKCLKMYAEIRFKFQFMKMVSLYYFSMRRQVPFLAFTSKGTHVTSP